MKMIVGLGNPGKEYDNTRHNIGFTILDYFACNEKWKKVHNSLVIKTTLNGEQLLLVKPQQYMNLSGEEVTYFRKYYKIEITDLLVIQDDIDMNLGNYKIKTDSSAGGHNGIKSIIQHLKSQSFVRLKVGVSNDKNVETKDYVLGNFSKEEKTLINKMIPIFENIIKDFVLDGANYIMNKYNHDGKNV